MAVIKLRSYLGIFGLNKKYRDVATDKERKHTSTRGVDLAIKHTIHSSNWKSTVVSFKHDQRLTFCSIANSSLQRFLFISSLPFLYITAVAELFQNGHLCRLQMQNCNHGNGCGGNGLSIFGGKITKSGVSMDEDEVGHNSRLAADRQRKRLQKYERNVFAECCWSKRVYNRSRVRF